MKSLGTYMSLTGQTVYFFRDEVNNTIRFMSFDDLIAQTKDYSNEDLIELFQPIRDHIPNELWEAFPDICTVVKL